LVQIHIKPESQFEFVPRNTEESEFHDVVDFGDIAISVQSVVPVTRLGHEKERDNGVNWKETKGKTNNDVLLQSFVPVTRLYSFVCYKTHSCV